MIIEVVSGENVGQPQIILILVISKEMLFSKHTFIIFITTILCALLIFCDSVDQISLRDRLQRNPKLPSSLGGRPMKVLTGLYIESLGNFRAEEMSFDVDLYLYLSWSDPSLNHSETDFVLVNDPKIHHYIWLPDLYFANARISRFHDVMVPNMNLFISQNGSVAYSTRITLGVACNLELSLYPMDKQKCTIAMLSYAYVEDQLEIRWFDTIDPTRHNPNIQLPEFRISNITNEYCNGTYNYAIMEYSHKRDNFSCLVAIIHLNRQIGYHVVQTYIPSGLIVMISWVSFWIDRRAVPARVTLSFTTLLSLSTLGNGLRFGLPQVAYAKAIDFWFGACLFFVFLSLLEFAAVNSYMREADKFERFASYVGKKSSVFVKELSQDLSVKLPKIPRKITQQCDIVIVNGTLSNNNDQTTMAPLADEEKSLGTSNQASERGDETPSPTETLDERPCNWSSAATVGENCIAENNALKIPLMDEVGGGRCGRISSRLNWSPVITRRDEDDEEECVVECREICEEPSLKPDRSESTTKNTKASKRTSSAADGKNPLITNHFLRQSIRYSRKGLIIDRCSRWIFPLGFALWNLFYWTHYLWFKQKE